MKLLKSPRRLPLKLKMQETKQSHIFLQRAKPCLPPLRPDIVNNTLDLPLKLKSNKINKPHICLLMHPVWFSTFLFDPIFQLCLFLLIHFDSY